MEAQNFFLECDETLFFFVLLFYWRQLAFHCIFHPLNIRLKWPLTSSAASKKENFIAFARLPWLIVILRHVLCFNCCCFACSLSNSLSILQEANFVCVTRIAEKNTLDFHCSTSVLLHLLKVVLQILLFLFYSLAYEELRNILLRTTTNP